MKKINIAELLKDCPKGMELDCEMYDNLSYDYVNEEQNRIYCKVDLRDTVWFTIYGCVNLSPNAKCVIFPKGKTTWEDFRSFNDGDIVSTSAGKWVGITTGGKSGIFIPTYCVIKYSGEFEAYFDRKEKWSFNRLATEEEKAKLFQAIKDNGYHWNAETKTLEKLVEPWFKVGDKIKDIRNNSKGIILKITNNGYECNFEFGNFLVVFKEQDYFELVPNKFDITTLKPFESKVLVRDINSGYWRGAFYSHYKSKKFYTIGSSYYYQCIPYEENKHLLDTNDDCDEYYKTW